ncbi:MAG: V-type ATPase subunit [Spirochaetaceae bacterium]|jgi:vacuolar-type H+-ATPase subunit C/Vma6|nr:V-type ATPase subunit [Spirochaetaceae bacterium]
MISGERAYLYAKSCGIIGKSFVSKRLNALSQVSSLKELNDLIFPGEKNSDDDPGLLEKKITARSIKAILAIAASFRRTPEILVLLIRSYEYADLKRVLAAFCAGEQKAPSHTDLGRFSTVNFAAYPDLKIMLKRTEFEFLLKKNIEFGKIANMDAFNVSLDKQYYIKLLKILSVIPKNDCIGSRQLFGEEIALMNCWLSLRLRSYYGMNESEIDSHLINGKLDKQGKSLSSDAKASLVMSLDHFADWQNWSRKSLLNTESSGRFWKCDPRYVQNASLVYLYDLARRNFKNRPFTLDTACCFIRLKQFEEQVLTGLAEGIKLKLSALDVLKIMGVRL